MGDLGVDIGEYERFYSGTIIDILVLHLYRYDFPIL